MEPKFYIYLNNAEDANKHYATEELESTAISVAKKMMNSNWVRKVKVGSHSEGLRLS